MVLTTIPAQAQLDWASIWMSMGWLDIVLLCAFIFGVFLGLRRGLAKTFPGFFEVMIAQTLSIEYSQAIAQFLNTGFKSIPVEILNIVVFAVLAVGSIVILRFLFRLLALVASVDFKSPLNNVGAAIVGGLQFMLLLGLVSYFLTLFPIPFLQETFNGRSISGPYLVASNQYVHQFLIKWFPDSWRAAVK